jgi:hypothetical protein
MAKAKKKMAQSIKQSNTVTSNPTKLEEKKEPSFFPVFSHDRDSACSLGPISVATIFADSETVRFGTLLPFPPSPLLGFANVAMELRNFLLLHSLPQAGNLGRTFRNPALAARFPQGHVGI